MSPAKPGGKGRGKAAKNKTKAAAFTPPDLGRVKKVLKLLDKLYPDASCTLDYKNPLQLLVATILSAQCTDQRVNLVTPDLFKRYKTAKDFAQAETGELEELIRSTGFFRNKAKSIIGMARAVVEQHGGEAPADQDALVKLPGVGRKTANVVLGNAYGVPGITVDTHVGRVCLRLGFTGVKDAVKAEFQLMEIVPQPHWTKFSHQVILHGREICKARKPACESCGLLSHCPFGQDSILV